MAVQKAAGTDESHSVAEKPGHWDSSLGDMAHGAQGQHRVALGASPEGQDESCLELSTLYPSWARDHRSFLSSALAPDPELQGPILLGFGYLNAFLSLASVVKHKDDIPLSSGLKHGFSKYCSPTFTKQKL